MLSWLDVKVLSLVTTKHMFKRMEKYGKSLGYSVSGETGVVCWGFEWSTMIWQNGSRFWKFDHSSDFYLRANYVSTWNFSLSFQIVPPRIQVPQKKWRRRYMAQNIKHIKFKRIEKKELQYSISYSHNISIETLYYKHSTNTLRQAYHKSVP